MKQPSHEPLAVGRAAFARTLESSFFWQHGKTLAFSLLSLIVLCFFFFQIAKNSSSAKSPSYMEADKLFHAWNANPSPETLGPLEICLKAHPDLESKFAGLIAQKLLVLGDAKTAMHYAGVSAKKVHALISPYYERFSQNSLAIAQGKFVEAIDAAKRLKQDLEKDESFWQNKKHSTGFGTLLYAYNLMRIASLEKELGSREGELQALEEISNNAGFGENPERSATYDPKAYAILEKNFTQDNLNLRSYIEHRKKELH